MRQYINMSEEKVIRIIESSGKQCDSDGWSELFLANSDVRMNGNVFIFEEEMRYFDNQSKGKNFYLKLEKFKTTQPYFCIIFSPVFTNTVKKDN